MKFGLLQYSPEWEDVERNFRKVNDILDNSLTDEDAVILPEMSLTGFTMNSDKYAEDIDGFCITGFIKMARKYHKHIFAGIIEKSDEGIFNSLFHFDNSGIITAVYRKVHPFSLAKEDKFYSAGSETVLTKINGVTIGLSICYDLRFPELYRYYGKERAAAVINVANWPVQRIHHWTALMRARAIENQAFFLGVNRTGNDPFYQYNGASAVYDPMGELIASAGEEETLVSVEIDAGYAAEVRQKFPFLDDIKLL